MKILIFGEIIYDEIEGNLRLGGAPLNLAVNLFQKNMDPYLVSGVGGDDLGRTAILRLKEIGLCTDYIRTIDNDKTGLAKVVIGKDGQPSFDIIKNVAYDHIHLEDRDLNQIIKTSFSCLCFGSLAQRSRVSRSTLELLQNKVGSDYVFCDLNLRNNFYTKNIILSSLKKADILKVSEAEAGYLNDLLYRGEKNYQELSRRLREDFLISVILITRGKNGCLAYSKSDTVDAPGIPIKVVDAVGAGDAFSAGFLAEYLKSSDLKKACLKANELGAHIAAQAGAI